MELYRIGLRIISDDECVIRAKNRAKAIARARKIYKNKAVTVLVSKKDVWWVDPDMLDTISKEEIID